MPHTEIDRIVDFVREQRRLSRSLRHCKRRLANYGFSIARVDESLMITTLPKQRPICPLPPEFVTM